MVLDEEKHGDWFESQLDAIARVGIENYLAQQIDPSNGP
jgi:bacterioferritin